MGLGLRDSGFCVLGFRPFKQDLRVRGIHSAMSDRILQ